MAWNNGRRAAELLGLWKREGIPSVITASEAYRLCLVVGVKAPRHWLPTDHGSPVTLARVAAYVGGARR